MMEYRRAPQPGNSQDKGVLIYSSFAGAGSTHNTNGILAESPNMFWSEEKIEQTVDRQYVLANLHPEEQARLDEPLGFGDGLTDDTYMEWIDSKAKRIFLILVDLGVPDQIFGIIDDSWDDDDLPIPLDQVERLQLTYDKDEKVDKKFYHRQFLYLLRSIQKGDQLVYEEEEIVPLEQAERKAVGQVAGLTQSNVDKVHLPGRPDDVFVRKRIPLGRIAGRMPQEEFQSGLQAMRSVEHNHLVSIWASYIHRDAGYLLLTPVNDSTLKSFLAVTPPSFKILAKLDRRVLLLNWIHCLADAVSFLHSLGQSHKNIKPSTVMLDHDNHIFLGDSGVFANPGLVGEKRSFDKESYDYSSPEHALRPSIPTPILVPMTSPVTRPGSARRSTLSSGTSQSMSTFSNDGNSIAPSSTWSPFSSSTSTSTSPPRNSPPTKRNSLSRHDPQKSDVFNLGTIFLEILTFFMKKASSKFSSHRSAKNKTPGRGGGLPDSSFHKNLGQVESWVAILTKDALKKEDKMFRGIERLLILTEKMISANPDERPTSHYVKERILAILTEFCGMGLQGMTAEGKTIPSRGRIHCDGRQMEEEKEEWNFGFEEMRIASQQAAAKACANVSPTGTELRAVGLNGGLVYGVERNSLVAPSVGSGYTNSSSGGASIARMRTQESDGVSTITRSSNKSSDGKSKSGGGSVGAYGGNGKVKPKVKKWQAPVYAGKNLTGLSELYWNSVLTGCDRNEFWINGIKAPYLPAICVRGSGLACKRNDLRKI